MIDAVWVDDVMAANGQSELNCEAREGHVFVTYMQAL
jgi:hypothetical protein